MDDRRGAAELGSALRAASPVELYRFNAFRVTGLPVDATPAEVRRSASQLRAAHALGVDAQLPGQVLPLTPAPSHELVEQALARLRDPISQVVDMFFWFWPGNDAATAALAAGDLDGAERAWDADGSAAASHNLAVLNHLLALDAEHVGKTPPRYGAAARWRETYRHWLAAWRDDAVWVEFADRVMGLRHPGLDATVAATVRDLVPTVVMAGTAAVALRGADRGWDDERIRVHWRLVHRPGFPDDTRAVVVRAATDQIVERLEVRLEKAEQDLSHHPERADELSERLAEATHPLLVNLELARTADSDALHDGVARLLLRCAYTGHQHLGDWERTRTMLRRAQRPARGEMIRTQVREDILAVERMLENPRRPEARGYTYRVPTQDELEASAEAERQRNIEIILEELRKVPNLLTEEREAEVRRLGASLGALGGIVFVRSSTWVDNPIEVARRYREIFAGRDHLAKVRREAQGRRSLLDELRREADEAKTRRYFDLEGGRPGDVFP
ncbi:hypothetical protein [Cryptosporangium arvum]|uniref:Uncharacterized protein n=1 Tax=Cryptosporangium arvum DSM 44712 TaxID=927661 RepID=A0A011AKN1_9ACTN|nr:hypothetical protein [Cryptosporangium arvum]EXG82531.1 hypothetical protein CryarDRAFT_3722 [Cryptosporangium arvum DSM 44712]